jgi:hypothetical protein
VAVVEFAFGIVERRMREKVNPFFVACIIYNNDGICNSLLTDVKTLH